MVIARLIVPVLPRDEEIPECRLGITRLRAGARGAALVDKARQLLPGLAGNGTHAGLIPDPLPVLIALLIRVVLRDDREGVREVHQAFRVPSGLSCGNGSGGPKSTGSVTSSGRCTPAARLSSIVCAIRSIQA